MSLALPDGIDWWIHRIAASERYSASLIEIETMWSMADVQAAHYVEDAIEAAIAQAAPKPKGR